MTEQNPKIPKLGIKKVTELILDENLKIPEYQRPYKWQSRHVIQLIEDILEHTSDNKPAYRLGTIVLHNDSHNDQPSLNVVDGQQRLITLSLIWYFVKEKNDKTIPPLLTHEPYKISRQNACSNYLIIKEQLKGKEGAFQKLLKEKCELVYAILDDESEAFQLFDSQNSRGKELETYNLLKAFHLREMKNNTEEEKKDCVKKWEEVSSRKEQEYSELKELLHENLYKIRKWLRGENGKKFTKNELDFFKGINLEDKNPYNYLQPYEIISYFIEQHNNLPLRNKEAYPFQIDQTIINGKMFFEYIQHYIKRKRDLFKKKSENEILKLLDNYSGRYRIGDTYIRNLFNCALLYYYDKFGEANLDEFIEIVFIWSYFLRLNNKRVTITTTDKAGKNSGELPNVFHKIKYSLRPKEVFTIKKYLKEVCKKNLKDENDFVGGIENIKEEFKKRGYWHESNSQNHSQEVNND